jgi:hypothetical protein
MFETPEAEALLGLVTLLGDVDPAHTDTGIVDQLDALERVKSAAAAAQARITADLDEVRHAADSQSAHPSDASIGAEVGLARRESPHRGRSLLELARALARDLPATMAALARGDLSEHRAMLIAAQTRETTAETRRAVDADLAARPETLTGLGDRRLQWEVQRAVMRHDPDGAEQRREVAVRRRHVTGRRLPDGTGQITAVVSEHAYAAILQSLHTRARTDIARGEAEGRSHAQMVADLFTTRLTGQITAQAAPLKINLVVTAETLLGDGDEPAELPGHGPIPAGIARKLALAAPEHDTIIRRLFRFDDTDRLVAMESTQRGFTGLLREFIEIRDQVCRTPFCGSPIRHDDHITAARREGATIEANAQGLCEACNHLKEQPGWHHQTVSESDVEPHTVEVTTPTGHRHRTTAPPAPPGQRWVEKLPGHWVLVA